MPKRNSRTAISRMKCFCLFQVVISVAMTVYMLLLYPEDKVPVTRTYSTTRSNVNLLADEMKSVKERSLVSSWIRFGDKESYVIFNNNRLLSSHRTPPYARPASLRGPYPYFSKTAPRPSMPVWAMMKKDYCDGCCVTYARRMIYFRDVTIYPQFCRGKVGGEPLHEAMNQSEQVEYLHISKGFFTIDSPSNFAFNRSFERGLMPLMEGVLVKETNLELLDDRLTAQEDVYTIVTTRHDYANLYHSMMNWYDIFFIMIILRLQPYQMQTIWLDAHPWSDLDHTWETLVGKAIRAGSIKAPVRFRHMVLNGIGSLSHVNDHIAPDLPFVEEFRHFVLSRFQVEDDHDRLCRYLKVTIIWRRSYVAHPRNPGGKIERQFANETEILNAINGAFPAATVTGIQLDTLPMLKQLELITHTDILIGMHGAGLSHILFLPKTAGVIEVFPRYMSLNAHFRSMSLWRRIPYISWKNKNSDREVENGTIVPTDLLLDMVKKMQASIC